MVDLTCRLHSTDLLVSFEKTFIGGSDKAVAKAIHHALLRIGTRFRLTDSGEVRDLGVGQSGGRKRSCRLWKDRLSRACVRARKANTLRCTGASARLIAAGAIPAAAYGANCGYARLTCTNSGFWLHVQSWGQAPRIA